MGGSVAVEKAVDRSATVAKAVWEGSLLVAKAVDMSALMAKAVG